MFTPPVEAKRRSRPSGSKIPQRCAPWNLYPARNVNTNGHIEVECFNLLKPDGTIPLGICSSNIRFFQKLHQRSVSGAFYIYFDE